MNLAQSDPKIAELIQQEARRQESTLELIASENHVSPAVMEAAGSVLTNKYAEGYPNARYYQGCGFYDQIETLAIDRAKQLFGCQFANVQPHSGAQANGAVFLAMHESRRHIRELSFGRWRPPFPRPEGQHERQMVQPGPLSARL